MLRPYQQEAVDAALVELKKTVDPLVIEAATGAGKSHIIAALADWVMSQSNTAKVLCLAPSKELVEQNYAKFLATGHPASFFSASVGEKSTKHRVIFGTPLTVKNALTTFPKIALVIIDECHGITPTIKEIIEELKKKTPGMRVIGLSATPYRTGEGYIYSIDQSGKAVEQVKDPYFTKCVYAIEARELIDQGYLTPPVTADTSTHYDTSQLEQDRFGNFKADQVEKAFTGHGRLTATIVEDVINHSRARKGVVIFAASISHAHEVLASLPPSMSAMVTGSTSKKERAEILKQFKARKIKYLVNVAVLTTGFDAPHIDVVAILRATESPGLLQQIIGRGLRLSQGKTDCLILDYAENIERHCPDGDIFNPELKVIKTSSGAGEIKAECPMCAFENAFTGRPNDDGWQVSIDGYFTDLAGNYIMSDEEDAQPIPAHYGRRCLGTALINKQYARCEYRWSSKECSTCSHHNDIAARYCESCKAELVDPNEKLKIEFAKFKKDPYTKTTDKVLDWSCKKHISAKGNVCLLVNYQTEFRTFAVYYMEGRANYKDLCRALLGREVSIDVFLANWVAVKPLTVTVQQDKQSKFFNVTKHNEDETVCQKSKSTTVAFGANAQKRLWNRSPSSISSGRPTQTSRI